MAQPESHAIFSTNKEYFIDFKADAKQQKVMRGNTSIWSFHYNVHFDDELFVSNNGKFVYVVRSKFVQNHDITKPALYIFSKKGLVATYSYKKLSYPRRYQPNEAGPIGAFWRIWRQDVKVVYPQLLIIKTNGKKLAPIHMNYPLKLQVLG
jgi:hypothetical protein